MVPLLIEINEENLQNFILQKSQNLKINPSEYVSSLVKSEMGTTIDISDIKTLGTELLTFFNSQYEKRFGIYPNMGQDESLLAIYEVIVPMYEQMGDFRKIQTILQKGIIWYLFCHDNTSQEGSTYPYGVKYLFSAKNSWLLKTCIESSIKLDDKTFKLMRDGNLSREEAIRTIRRGDQGSSAKQVSVVALLDTALKLYGYLKRTYDSYLPSNFKFLPGIELLFKAETPSEEYIQNAITTLTAMKKSLEAKAKSDGK